VVPAWSEALVKYLWYGEVVLSRDKEGRTVSSLLSVFLITRLLGWGSFLPTLGRVAWMVRLQRFVSCQRDDHVSWFRLRKS